MSLAIIVVMAARLVHRVALAIENRRGSKAANASASIRVTSTDSFAGSVANAAQVQTELLTACPPCAAPRSSASFHHPSWFKLPARTGTTEPSKRMRAGGGGSRRCRPLVSVNSPRKRARREAARLLDLP